MLERLERLLKQAGIIPGLTDLLNAGQDCFLVGGALRDLHIGKTVYDFDFATPYDPTELARSFASVIGGKWFFLDKKRRQSRIAVRNGTNFTTYDFAPFRAPDLSGDLKLRDFTVNAIAFSLSRNSSYIDIQDPLNGREDLFKKVLRYCSPAAFKNDPLRVLRAVRHSLGLSLDIEEKTSVEISNAAAFLTQVPNERITQELSILFRLHNIEETLRLLEKYNLISILFGPCGNSFSFEKGVADAVKVEVFFKNLESQDEFPAFKMLGQEMVGNGFERQAFLKFCAFLKGAYGKSLPGVSELKVCFSKENQSVLRDLLALDFEKKAEEMKSLIDRPRSQMLWASTLGSAPLEAFIFLSAFCQPPLNERDRFFKILNNISAHPKGELLPDLVDGNWIRKNLTLAQGPQVGKFLLRLREAEIAGLVRSKEEAEKFLTDLKND